MISFRVSDSIETDDRFDGRYFEVRIYASRRHYRRAAIRHGRYNIHPDDFSANRGSLALFRPFALFVEDPKMVGIFYFSLDDLTAEVVSHEAVHAAVHIHRIRHGRANLSTIQDDAGHEREEEIAESVGAIVAFITDQIWDRKIWRGRRT
jgi:hypothetical protein